MTTVSHKYVYTHTQIYLYHWCHDLTHREVKMGKIHIVALSVFVLHVTLSKVIKVYFDQNLRWTEVDGIGDYELLSYALPIFIELLLYVCATIIKLFLILACIITICIELSIKILVASVIYVIQFRSGVALMLVERYRTYVHFLKQFWLWSNKWFQVIIAARHTAAYVSIPDISVRQG